MEAGGCWRVPWSPACCTCSRCRRSPAEGSSHHPPVTPQGRDEEQRQVPSCHPSPQPSSPHRPAFLFASVHSNHTQKAPGQVGAGQEQAAACTGVCCSPKAPRCPPHEDTQTLTTCFCLRGFTQKVPSLCWREENTCVGMGAEHPRACCAQAPTHRVAVTASSSLPTSWYQADMGCHTTRLETCWGEEDGDGTKCLQRGCLKSRIWGIFPEFQKQPQKSRSPAAPSQAHRVSPGSST